MLESSRRPLTPAEQRLLGAKIRDLESRLRRGPKVLIPGGAVLVILWALTLIVSGSSWLIVTSFWIVVGTGILVWVGHDLKKDLGILRDMLGEYESARRRNEAEVFEVKARAFAEFEELEDEGACYAFEIAGNRLVFVLGQEFYPQAKFPSHDFSLVYVLNERGGPVDMVIEKRGPKAPPARTISAAAKLELEVPEHLEVFNGKLSRIEDLLSSAHRGSG
ncbi:MAG: hypothetical protein JSW46_08915 [Gemmatimonadota bacterium]|nr:MAG: hypothetical protein JSW46_08915 [Gemmatimonadota bacterium]